MALGVCCQWLKSRTKRDGTTIHENSTGEKSLQLGFYKQGRYDNDRIRATYHNNVDGLFWIIKQLDANKIKAFRMSSNILPLFDYAGDIAKNDRDLLEKLKQVGREFMKREIRVSCHPGPFVVISSDKPDVIDRSIVELKYHAWLFDAMGLDQSTYYAINVHGGKRDRADKLVDVINNRLPPNVRNRITLENDEHSYSAKELCSVYRRTGIPIVFDTHHHVFNEGGWSITEASDACADTWKDIKPIQHISNTEPGLENGSFKDRRKHSWYIHYIPEYQKELIKNNVVDVDVEAKGKNFALLKMREDFDIKQ